MHVSALLERPAYRTDAAVHHVGRRDDVGAGLGVGQRLPDQHGDRVVVQHVALVVDDAVLPVRRVRVERDVGDDDEIGKPALDCPNRALHEAIGIGAFGAVQQLEAAVDDREQGDGRNTEILYNGEFFEQAADISAADAGHRRHGLAVGLAVVHEDRVDEVGARQRRLGDETAQRRSAAAAAHAQLGELTGSR